MIPLELFNQLGISSGLDVSDFHRGHGTFENCSSQWGSGSQVVSRIQVSESEEHTMSDEVEEWEQIIEEGGGREHDFS